MQGITLHDRFMFTFGYFRRVIALIFVLVSAVNLEAQEGNILFQREKVQSFCTETKKSFTYTAETTDNQIFPNAIGCLLTSPSGKWFIMQIAEEGDLEMKISHSDNRDVDYAVFGPYGRGQLLDKEAVLDIIENNPSKELTNSCNEEKCDLCSYLPDHTEYIKISNDFFDNIYVN